MAIKKYNSTGKIGGVSIRVDTVDEANEAQKFIDEGQMIKQGSNILIKENKRGSSILSLSSSGYLDLGTFNPVAITLDSSGVYDDYTSAGNITFGFDGTPINGIWQKVRITLNGSHTLTIPESSVIYNNSFVDGSAPASDTYDLAIAYIDNEYVFNLIAVSIKAVSFPTMTSFTMSADNTYGDLVLSEGIYGANDGSTPAALADLSIVFAQAGGTATDWTESSAKQNDSATEGSASALAGGETTIRIFGAISGSVDGNETVTVTPADGTSLYDLDGNAMDSGESAVDNLGVLLLKDDFAGTTIDITTNWDLVEPNTPEPLIAQDDGLELSTDSAGGAVANQDYLLSKNSWTGFLSAAIEFTSNTDTDWGGVVLELFVDGNNKVQIVPDANDPQKQRVAIVVGGVTEELVTSTINCFGNRWRIDIDASNNIKVYYYSSGWIEDPASVSGAWNYDIGANKKVRIGVNNADLTDSTTILNGCRVTSGTYSTELP